MNDVCTLISFVSDTDEIGNTINNETEKEVFCNIFSCTQSEFFSAAQNGMKAELKIEMWQADYNGESVVEVNNLKYAVYRTYKKSEDIIELYLEEKSGLNAD